MVVLVEEVFVGAVNEEVEKAESSSLILARRWLREKQRGTLETASSDRRIASAGASLALAALSLT